MDRKMIYPGQIPLETDLLDTNRFALIGLGKLAAAVLGTTTLVNGLACTPTAPASMQVKVAAGEIYSLQNLDGTAYSSLAADTTHSLLKQGLLMDAVNLTCPAPATSGQSVNYLVQAIYQDIDARPLTLPYYNASNPTQAYSGPAGGGTAQNTVRKGVCTVSVKAGIAATTGSQQTPAPDVGYVGLYSVTVAYGQASITAGNIAAVSGAPFINSTLFGANPAFAVMPTSPTPPQFDNSTKSATTAFVKRQGLQFGAYTDITASRALLAADIGCVLMNGGANTLTIPTPNSLGIPAGGAVLVTSYSSNCTLSFSGANYAYGAGGLSANLVIQPGEFLILTAQVSGTSWAIAGTANMGNMVSFTASKNSNGYQKLPGGLIIQWGSISGYETGGAGATTTWSGSFPIAFPTACLSVTLSAGEVAGSNEALEHVYSAAGWNATTLNVGVERNQGSSAGTSDIFNVRYIAIGY